MFWQLSVAGAKKKKDTADEKRKKVEGRSERDAQNSNSLYMPPEACPSCGEPGHTSSRSKLCRNHKQSIAEKVKETLGDSTEEYVRKVPFRSIVKSSQQEILRQNVHRLSSFIREVSTRAQIFVNHYIINLGDDPVPVYIFSQTFWYSVCQLVMNENITNSNPNFPEPVKEAWNAFRIKFANSVYTASKPAGYSYPLSSACIRLCTNYTNHIVENFEGRVVKFIKYKLRQRCLVSFCHTVK